LAIALSVLVQFTASDHPFQEWGAPVEAIPGCPPGLEYLTALDQILVKQQIELPESMG
jgi:hypothetical protein